MVKERMRPDLVVPIPTILGIRSVV